MLASRILVLLLLLHQFWHQNCNCCTNVGIKNSSARYEHGHRRGDAYGCRAGIPLFYSFTSFIISPIKMVSIGISPMSLLMLNFHEWDLKLQGLTPYMFSCTLSVNIRWTARQGFCICVILQVFVFVFVIKISRDTNIPIIWYICISYVSYEMSILL